MNKINRLVSIIIFLQSKRFVRVEEIAEHFSISRRTVYRDVRLLEEGGLPLVSEPGKGYGLMQEYRLPPALFTPDEAGALLLGGRFLEKLSDDSLKGPIQSALTKVRAVLLNKTKDHVERLEQSVSVSLRASPFESAYLSSLLLVIQHAIINRKVLRLEYFSNHRTEYARRDVEPMHLYFYTDHWHLVGFCRLRQDYRDFRLDRIKNLGELSDSFHPRPDFSAETFREHRFEMENATEIQIRIRKRPFFRQPALHDIPGVLSREETDSDVTLTMMVDNMSIVLAWLFTLGDSVEVIYPEEVRQMLIEKVEEVLAHHRRAQTVPV
jgi:predicted DNA-binding transcriptional regulator YafY